MTTESLSDKTTPGERIAEEYYSTEPLTKSRLAGLINDGIAAAVAEAGKWQDISTAPKNGRPILLWLEDEGFSVKAMWRRPPLKQTGCECWWSFELDEDVGTFHNPTHWMPLPQPPQGGGR